MSISAARIRHMKEKDARDLYIQSVVRYETECGECITRQATEEEIKKYGIKIKKKESE